MAHPLDDPRAGDHWIFSHPRPDGSLFKRLFVLVADTNEQLQMVADYYIMSPIEDFPFETGIWKNGKWEKRRTGAITD